MKRSMMLVVLTSAVLVACSAAQAVVTISWATVGDEGNAANDVGVGSVAYRYAISQYEVTNAQYVDFLNSVAASDAKGLYNTNMAGTVNASNPLGLGGIVRSGSAGSYVYTLKEGWANKPVNFVSYYDSLRFVNWLENGQPTTGGESNTTTEKGVYNLTGGAITRSATAHYWLPSENEWVKAAYYKGGSTNAGYWDYATQSNTAPGNPAPAGTSNSANYFVDDYATGSPKYLTDAGAYTTSKSAYGTYDQNGNVWEIVDTAYQGVATKRVVRGGAFDSFASYLASMGSSSADLTKESANMGFRVAGLPIDGPPPVVIVTGALHILKFNDHDHDGIQDAGDEPLSGWSYHVVGTGYDNTLTTDALGSISVTLEQGQYTITETAVADWIRTTPAANPLVLALGDSASAIFGGYYNQLPEPATMAILGLGGLFVARVRRNRIR